MKIRWRQLARALHRDLGFLLFGLTVAYALSGIALNHRKHWNPSYQIENYSVALAEAPAGRLDTGAAKAFLAGHGIGAGYKKHYEPDAGSVRFFFKDGSATLVRAEARLDVELLKRRPLLHTLNTLHYNPGTWWTWFADIFSVGLIVLAVSGLFLVKNSHGITRKGGLLVVLGILIPGVMVYYYL